MKKNALLISSMLLILMACNNESPEEINTGELDKENFLAEVTIMDSIMASGIPSKKDVTKAVVLYQDYVNHFPDDPKSADYLMQVSDFYLNMGKPQKAVNTLTELIEKYPDYNKLEAAYFARASHVDFDLRDTTLAKTYYAEFLEKYPNSEYATGAIERQNNIGLSLEDLVKKFEEMNANK